MRKNFFLSLFVLTCVIILIQSPQLAYSKKDGAPAGVTGSPFNAKTCSNPTDISCHGGTATVLLNLITSDVPITGYTPGDTFTITATVSSPNLIRFGFEISPQDNAGNLLGKILITDPARTHFTPSNGIKYITHDSSGSWAPSHTNAWSFGWVAPDSGTGDVTFYGAFNYANNDEHSTGDVIHTSTLTVSENTVGIDEAIVISSMNVYPNPVSNLLELNYYLQKPENAEVNLFDVNGLLVMRLVSGMQNVGAQKISVNLDEKISSGIYLLQLKAGEQVMIKKIVKL